MLLNINTKSLVILMGIQASGKTTFYKQQLEGPGLVHVNLDTLHTRGREANLLAECLKEGRSVVIDNTNPCLNDRERYIPRFKAQGYKIVGVFVQSIIRDCIRRNESRERQVPRVAILGTFNKLEFPSYDEGFDELYFAKIGDNNDFEITNWIE